MFLLSILLCLKYTKQRLKQRQQLKTTQRNVYRLPDSLVDPCPSESVGHRVHSLLSEKTSREDPQPSVAKPNGGWEGGALAASNVLAFVDFPLNVLPLLPFI